jgi:fumarate hydratase class II
MGSLSNGKARCVMSEFRVEKDSMGEMQVPATALWGASTQRAVLNFPVSGWRFVPRFLRALGLIKFAAAEANRSLGRLDAKMAALIQKAAREMMDGKLDQQFPLDVFQTGSGTSTNMNANEVIANRAMQLAIGSLGDHRIHPNDHVNMGQSSNDVIPTAIHVAAVEAFHKELQPALHKLHKCLAAKARELDEIVKIGRTHLMDATPIRLGQVFSGYASQVAHADRRIGQKVVILRELPIGGTAVGTGINTHPQFAKRVCEIINHETHESFHEAHNHFEAQHAKDAVVGAAAMLKTVAISVGKIANDIRWLSSGPRCGFGELTLPATQPGSSIMPGKVNPVICESVMQVCAQVVGADAAITFAAATLGAFELHVGMPGHGPQPAHEHADLQPGVPCLRGQVPGWLAGQQAAVRGPDRAEPDDVHVAGPDCRLRRGRRDRQRSQRQRQDGAAGGHRTNEGRQDQANRGPAQGSPRPAQHDDAERESAAGVGIAFSSTTERKDAKSAKTQR